MCEGDRGEMRRVSAASRGCCTYRNGLLVAALAVALAVALASASLFFFARDSLRNQVDEGLIEQA